MAKREKKTAKKEDGSQTEIDVGLKKEKSVPVVSECKIGKLVDVREFFEKFSNLAKSHGFESVNSGWNGEGHVEFWLHRGEFPKLLSFLSDVIGISDEVRVSFSGDAYCGDVGSKFRLKVCVPAPLTVQKVG